jgi:hypothetical protein
VKLGHALSGIGEPANFSMRPVVSRIFFDPVKNGWQWEQISTRTFFFVMRVWNTWPHAHVMVVCS